MTAPTAVAVSAAPSVDDARIDSPELDLLDNNHLSINVFINPSIARPLDRPANAH